MTLAGGDTARTSASTAFEPPSVRQELVEASRAQIEAAVAHAEPMVLRGLLYQLTGDEEVAATRIATDPTGFQTAMMVARDEDVALLRREGGRVPRGLSRRGRRAARDRPRRSGCRGA